jgi:imidazolonepropionase-like amidohydrolase
VAAQFMGWSSRVGSVEADKFGDVIAVKGDPLKDISVLQNVAVVVKGGMLFKTLSQ